MAATSDGFANIWMVWTSPAEPVLVESQRGGFEVGPVKKSVNKIRYLGTPIILTRMFRCGINRRRKREGIHINTECEMETAEDEVKICLS